MAASVGTYTPKCGVRLSSGLSVAERGAPTLFIRGYSPIRLPGIYDGIVQLVKIQQK